MLAIIYLILQLVLAEAQVLLSIKSEPKFPHFIGNQFLIQIQPLDQNIKLSADPTDTMAIRLVDLNFTEKERVLFNYGVHDALDEEFNGKYLDIKVWEKNPSFTKMNISLTFKRDAHRKYLEIFYFSAPNKFVRKKYLKNLSLAKRLFHELIDLFIPPKLSISVHPIKVDKNEIIINDLVMASCKAFDGIPKEKPKFGNLSHLNVIDTKYNEKNNEIKMYFNVSRKDHFSYFTCTAGNVTDMYTIRINHHPSEIIIKPDINEILVANRTISCYTQDGYPKPVINFQLIEGPLNASLYYEIQGNGSQIFINSNTPTKSEWIFKCSVKSTIIKVTKIITKAIKFKIASHPTTIDIYPIPNEILESNSTINCVPVDGYPSPTVHWEIVTGPENSYIYYNILQNGTQIHFSEKSPTKSEWHVKCVLESCMEGFCKFLNSTISFRIANHPTKLYIHPIIKKRLRSNSTIKCLTTDGYPDPEINWQFIEGPQNAQFFYNITGNPHEIHINSNSPIGSKWTFRCTLKSNLTRTHRILNKIISFAIAKNPMEICDEKCLNSRISEIEESVEENSKLHDVIKLILNVTNQMKEQIEVQMKSLKAQKKREEQMEIQRKEQIEKSDKLNATIQRLNAEINSQIKYLNNSLLIIMMSPFHHVFDKITYIDQYSPEFPSVFLLSVQFLTYYWDELHETFGCELRFINKRQIPIYIDMTYICSISAKRNPNKIKTATFNVKYRRNTTFEINSVKCPSNEIFGNNLSDTQLSVRCHIDKYTLYKYRK